jgi:hypothetical protein
MTASKVCPKCFLTDDKLGTCGNFALGCPKPVDFDPEKMVHIVCTPCKKDVAVPVDRIMSGKTARLQGCQSDKCKARIMQAAIAPQEAPATAKKQK